MGTAARRKSSGGTTEMSDPDRECLHPDFIANVNVIRIGEHDPESGGRPRAFAAEITVGCAACGERFRWIGCEPGLRSDRPMMSVDEYELRAPIRPASADADWGLGIPGFGVVLRRYEDD